METDTTKAKRLRRRNRRLARKLRPWRPVAIRALLLIPLLLWGFSWPSLAAGRAQWIEAHYSEALYPTIRNAASILTALVPISVAELLLYALSLFVLWELVGGLVRLAARNLRLSGYLSRVLSLALLAATLLNLFYFTWGFQYFRTPLYQRMGLPVKARSVEELADYAAALSAQAAQLRETLPEDAKGVYRLDKGVQPMLNAMPETYKRLGAAVPLLAGRVTRAKRVLFSQGLSYLGISGVFIGLTGEPNVNVHQPDLLIPQAAAHETAHQLGVASEDEAEFVGYLACAASADPCVRYSGLMNALIHAGNALFDADPGRYYALRETYSEKMQVDLADYDAYWNAHEGDLSESADRVNDTYLKHNAQPSGVKSYGEVVDLLLAYGELTNR